MFINLVVINFIGVLLQARKALCALKGLVKLQALVRGNLVRKQATATLRCMQALVTVQARARVQRIRMTEETKPVNQRQLTQRKSTQDNRFRNTNHVSFIYTASTRNFQVIILFNIQLSCSIDML